MCLYGGGALDVWTDFDVVDGDKKQRVAIAIEWRATWCGSYEQTECEIEIVRARREPGSLRSGSPKADSALMGRSGLRFVSF